MTRVSDYTANSLGQLGPQALQSRAEHDKYVFHYLVRMFNCVKAVGVQWKISPYWHGMTRELAVAVSNAMTIDTRVFLVL